jgi:hypothetical protein
MRKFLNTPKGGALAVAAILWCGIASITYAQCPGSSGPAPDPSLPGDAWNSKTITITVPGTSCTETITYCWRFLGGGNNQVWVSNIQPGAGCDGVSPSILINAGVIAATDSMLIENTGIVACPNVGPQLQVSYYVASCWEKFGASGEYGYAPCVTDSYCVTSCDVCRDPVTLNVVYSNCTNSSVGDPVCAPDPGFEWLNGQCYTICTSE